MSVATRYDVNNAIEDIEFLLGIYLDENKNWYKYKLENLFPAMHNVGDNFARYHIFKVDK